jgi:transposase
MDIVATAYDHVVGVDTHARTHTYTVLQSGTGAVIDTASFPTSAAGNRRALAWIRRRCTGTVLAAVEGTSSYGSSIVAAFDSEGIPVTEVRPPSRSSRAYSGKSDSIDAEAAARGVLGRRTSHPIKPRTAGDRTALRVLLASRSLMDQQRTADRNALTALLRAVDLGIDARKPLTAGQLKEMAAWRMRQASGNPADLAATTARAEARRLAISVLDRSRQLEDNNELLRRYSDDIASGLQDICGIGPVTAAIIICAYSHHGRIRSEAAFAALGGVAPQPASSGNTSRHRLNRSGDRQLNRAFDIIARTRMSFDPETRAYVERSLAKGKTKREVRRSLKRYVCRSVFRQIQTIMA